MLSKIPKRPAGNRQAGPLILLLIGIAVVPLDHILATHIIVVSLIIITHRM